MQSLPRIQRTLLRMMPTSIRRGMWRMAVRREQWYCRAKERELTRTTPRSTAWWGQVLGRVQQGFFALTVLTASRYDGR